MANTPVRQYIGARYVPLFADPAEWNSNRTYEPLTIVIHNGNSYTSRQYVPAGIDITNHEYWANTGNYNAQIEAYRKETQNITNILNYINWNTPEAAAQWINNAEQTETQTTANTNALKALKAETVEKAEKLYNKIYNKTILIIGDSYSDPSFNQNNWVKYFKTMFNANIINISERGAGWVQGGGTTGKNFKDIINEYTPTTDIDTVIIYGGYNDIRTNKPATEIEANINSGLTQLKSKLPNSQIHLFAINYTPTNKLTAYFYSVINAWIRPIKQYDYGYIHTGCENWLLSPYAYTTDNVHPNDTGYKLIALYIAQGLSGATQTGNTQYIGNGIITPEENVTIDAQSVKILNGVIYIPSLGIQAPNAPLNTETKIGTYNGVQFTHPYTLMCRNGDLVKFDDNKNVYLTKKTDASITYILPTTLIIE